VTGSHPGQVPWHPSWVDHDLIHLQLVVLTLDCGFLKQNF
jgi:hypothetical protein